MRTLPAVLTKVNMCVNSLPSVDTLQANSCKSNPWCNLHHCFTAFSSIFTSNCIVLPQLLTQWLHCMLSLAVQCIVIGPVCLWVCVCMCVCGSVTTITRNCVHRFSPNWVCRWREWRSPADYFDLPVPPGRGSVAGWNFLAPPYYSQRAVFASLWTFFSFWIGLPVLTDVNANIHDDHCWNFWLS